MFTAADLATQGARPPQSLLGGGRFVEAGREGTLPPSRLSFNRVRLVWRNDPDTPGGQQSVSPPTHERNPRGEESRMNPNPSLNGGAHHAQRAADTRGQPFVVLSVRRSSLSFLHRGHEILTRRRC